MSAMAFIVNPVNPKVGVIFVSPVFSAMYSPYRFFMRPLILPRQTAQEQNPECAERVILEGTSGGVKCNVSMPQITDSYNGYRPLLRRLGCYLDGK
jgi:hypothetical protein